MATPDALAAISREGPDFSADLWEDAALHSSPHWDEVRALAAGALEAFGWPVESPPPERDARDAGYAR